jgi:8-oxo-dGTP pyrophosphatase MutT (NUDIX family)
MYKVFFNESFLILAEKPLMTHENNVRSVFLDNMNQLKEWLEEAEQSANENNVIFYCSNFTAYWEKFKKLFKLIEAAGGLVCNREGKCLLIFRRGKWDLPKGKIDKGERPDEAAIREVHEETGLANAAIDKKLLVTYHIYYYKSKLAIKPTHWYLMDNLGSNELIPQTSEDIEKAVWLTPEEVNNLRPQMFHSIVDVVNIFIPAK